MASSSSSGRTPLPRLATLADLLSIDEEDRFHEVLDGEVVPKESAGFKHGLGQSMLAEVLGPFKRRPNGPSRPGGWWILTEATIRLSPHQIVQPDLAGWRRERLPQPPEDYPVPLRPDWICEIHCAKDAKRRDTLQKRRIYAEAGVPHYWLVDADDETLTVLRLAEGTYAEVLTAGRGEAVRAEPFDALELSVGALFGDDPA
ncbi:MAG: Uma2 family endonuclease [Polyangia bacterium]